MPLGAKVGFRLGHFVLHGAWGFELSSIRGSAQPPIFGPCLLWPNGRPSQLLLKWVTVIHLLYRGRNAHIFVRSRLKLTDKSITCTQISQWTDNDLVDLSRLSQSMVRQVSRLYAQRLTPGTTGCIDDYVHRLGLA